VGFCAVYRLFSGFGLFLLSKFYLVPPTRPLTQTVGQPNSWLMLIYLKWRIEMTKNVYAVVFVLIMIAVIVSVDLLFFKNHFWERLMANIGIVLVFVAFYLRFLK
jgi:hypothetical protein